MIRMIRQWLGAYLIAKGLDVLPLGSTFRDKIIKALEDAGMIN